MPTRGRRNKVEDEDDANEVFASESSPSPEQKLPTKRTSTPAASATKAPRYARKVGKAKSNDNDIERDDEEEFSCSHCSKKFKSALGLKYHTDNKVCQTTREEKKATPKAKKNATNANKAALTCKGACAHFLVFETITNLSRNHFIAKKVCQQVTTEEKETLETFTCSFCAKVFTSEPGLKYHERNKVCQTIVLKEEEQEEEEFPPLAHDGPRPKRKAASQTKVSYAEGGEENESDEAFVDEGGNVSEEEEEEVEVVKEPRRKKQRKSEPIPMLPTLAFLKYHTEEVCGESTRRESKRRHKYEKLKKGVKFITKFGVVEVVADDRLPSDHHKSKAESKNKVSKAIHRFNEKEMAFNNKKEKVVEGMYVGARMRRELMNQTYQESIGKEDPSQAMTQSKVWGMYCDTILPAQILDEGQSWRDNNPDPKERFDIETFDLKDPSTPADYYPNRIVECKVISDERKVKSSNDAVDANAKHGTARPSQLQMNIFLARKELTVVYDATEPRRVCPDCGQSFHSKYFLQLHSGSCKVDIEARKVKREKKIKTRENNALIGSSTDIRGFLTRLHTIHTPKIVLFNGVEFGNPCKIKQFKKHKMPGWIVFNERHSSMYPELFISLGFKRGSQNRNWADKMALAEGYLSRNEKRRIRKKKRRRMKDPSNLFGPNLVNSMTMELKPVVASSKPTDLVSAVARGIDEDEQSMGAASPTFEDVMPRLPPMDEDIAPALPPLNNDFDSIHFSADNDAFPGEGEVDPALFVHHNEQQAVPTNWHHMSSNPLFSGAWRPLVPPMNYDMPAYNGMTMQPMQMPPFNQNVDQLSSSAADVDAVEKEDTSNKIEELTDQTALRNENKKPETKPPTISQEDNQSGLAKKANALCDDSKASSKDDTSRGTSRDRRIALAHKTLSNLQKYPAMAKQPVVIDAQVLASECHAGRYPTITRFNGEHKESCVLCDADDDTPLIECDFCERTAHQDCINKVLFNKDQPVIVRESEADDSMMCHECITVTLHRRARAEMRRMTKWNTELAKAGILPESANLPREINTCQSDGDLNDDKPTYAVCPSGGPGGLICCSYCSASYSRFLSNTAKEMEAQSLAKAGQDTKQLLELLADAKSRLLSATEVMQTNRMRRELLRNNEG
ncbi:predicted protein [Thalassiosira pseudonana CCMP1335]|uniref:C2H2-type domain-containing protein n=1 Tax=Thalassiosira pseudonana TaxID=35128 RepID=B8BWF8_THAPS|nr:predicted protein [Thalassiosira pseudonana CCMP1335]EED94509.1 predicted protein [Thalassiosira pseudonana CCMP1335]